MDYGDWVRHHSSLGLPLGASKEEIKKAYRLLAREHHPDMVRDASAQRRATRAFREVHEAYEALRDFSGPPPVPSIAGGGPHPEGRAEGLDRRTLAAFTFFGACVLFAVVLPAIARRAMKPPVQHRPFSAPPPPVERLPVMAGGDKATLKVLDKLVAGPEKAASRGDRETIRTSEGEFEVLYRAGAREAINKIHEARVQFYSREGKGPDFMERENARLRAQDDGVSLFLRFNSQGKLVGVFRKKDDPFMPYELWAYDLDEKGKTAHVEVVPDERTAEPCVSFLLFSKDKRQLGRLSVTAFDAYQMEDPD